MDGAFIHEYQPQPPCPSYHTLALFKLSWFSHLHQFWAYGGKTDQRELVCLISYGDNRLIVCLSDHGRLMLSVNLKLPNTYVLQFQFAPWDTSGASMCQTEQNQGLRYMIMICGHFFLPLQVCFKQACCLDLPCRLSSWGSGYARIHWQITSQVVEVTFLGCLGRVMRTVTWTSRRRCMPWHELLVNLSVSCFWSFFFVLVFFLLVN